MGTLGERPHHEDGAWGAQRGSAHWLTYGDLASAGKTIFHLRTGRDEGMVDVFNVDLHEDLSDHDRTIRNALLSQSVMSLIDKAFRPSLAPTNLNLYLNRDILETRGLHFDDLRFRVKAFAYLTDVDDPSAGPYTYVPGSHRSTRHQKVTMWLNRRSGQERPLTDATSCPMRQAFDCSGQPARSSSPINGVSTGGGHSPSEVSGSRWSKPMTRDGERARRARYAAIRSSVAPPPPRHAS